jgi:hypothetical protein
MDPTTIAIGAILVSAISEILPFTPLKANGIVQFILQVARLTFPKR